MPKTREQPILIAGAGPGGLVAALTLQQQGVPFVVLEKVSREKLYANVGSGYDLSPTTVKIMKQLLGLDTKRAFIEYAGFHVVTLEGKLVKDSKIPASSSFFQQATRADIQRMLLDKIANQEKVLRCGVAVESYSEDAENGLVSASLTDGSVVVGRALLACDGIHSKIRKCMHGSDDVDPLSYCGTKCYWGVSPKPEPGSSLEAVIDQSQRFKETGPSFVIGLSTHRAPGSFFVTPNQGKAVWVLGLKSDEPTNTSDDLRRRGGGVLDEESKKALVEMLEARPGDFKLMLEIIKGTPANMITEAGLYDRKNRALPFSSSAKLVALLGDAAHPQSPFLGQGCNMAIADGYVCATLLATRKTFPEAIKEYDCDQRRKEAKETTEKARDHTDFCCSSNWFSCWFFYMLMKYMPLDGMADELAKPDKSNIEMLRRLHGEEELPKPSSKSCLPTWHAFLAVAVIPIVIYAMLYT